MPLRVTCPFCKAPCQVDDKFVGVAVQCHQCRQPFRVDSAARTTPAVGSASTGPLRLDIGAATSVGRVRKRNEDSYLVLRQSWSNLDEQHEVALLVVADGMGGYDAGDQASRLAIQTLGSSLVPFLTALCSAWRDPGTLGVEASLGLAISETNRVVHEASRTTPARKGMGSTAVVALVLDKRAYIGHVGDCRAYQVRGDQLTQITRDQTLVARMIELGQLTPREAEGHPLGNEVSQAIGKRADIEPGVYEATLQRDDWLILACDGLHTDVDPQTLPAQVRRQPTSAQELASRLVGLATQQGGRDNCTVNHGVFAFMLIEGQAACLSLHEPGQASSGTGQASCLSLRSRGTPVFDCTGAASAIFHLGKDQPMTSQYLAIDTRSLPWEERFNDKIGRALFRKELFQDPETGMMVRLVRYPAGIINPAHTHPCGHGMYVLEGSLVTHKGTYGPGSFVWFPEGEVMEHGASAEGDVTVVFITNKPFRIDYVPK